MLFTALNRSFRQLSDKYVFSGLNIVLKISLILKDFIGFINNKFVGKNWERRYLKLFERLANIDLTFAQ